MSNKKNSINNYVCPNCFYKLRYCKCDSEYPLYLIHIDKNIQKHIQILNKKGYKTKFCCEGHDSFCYITFYYDYFTMHNINNFPNGFNYDKKRCNLSYTFKKSLSDEEKEIEKENILKELLDFCKNLKDIN